MVVLPKYPTLTMFRETFLAAWLSSTQLVYMVNKNFLSGGCWKGILSIESFLFVALFAFWGCCFPYGSRAQSIENRYRSHLDGEGITYFFCPKRIGRCVNVDRFTYDMTYHTKGDSLFLNFTIITRNNVKIRDFELLFGETKRIGGSGVKTMFGDIRGKKYEIRTTSKFSLKDVYEVFSQPEVLSFKMTFDNGDVGRATYGAAKWRKDSRKIIRIIDLINYQK